jgi:hypothetical protein
LPFAIGDQVMSAMSLPANDVFVTPAAGSPR